MLKCSNPNCKYNGEPQPLCNKNKQDNPDIELHCHHVLPINESPVESADKDNCITVCKQCHLEIHQTVSGCGYGELKCSN